jgi:hypothetical protein
LQLIIPFLESNTFSLLLELLLLLWMLELQEVLTVQVLTCIVSLKFSTDVQLKKAILNNYQKIHLNKRLIAL